MGDWPRRLFQMEIPAPAGMTVTYLRRNATAAPQPRSNDRHTATTP
jgi:hypothetical protein